jgi:VanZ family protein
MRRLHLWLPPLLYMLLIFHFSSESNPVPELTAHVWDKLLHTAEYGGLGFLMYRAILGEGMGGIRAVLAAVVLSSVYGATDEWHQAFVPLRIPDVLDWLADTVGSTIGVALYVVFSRWPRNPLNRRSDSS